METLKQDHKLSVPVGKCTGPNLLCALLHKVYHPSQSKIQKLKLQLGALGLKDFPRENITLFVQAASLLICKIRMNFTQQDQIPDLTTSALQGLTEVSDACMSLKTQELRISSDVNGIETAGPCDKQLEALETQTKID